MFSGGELCAAHIGTLVCMARWCWVMKGRSSAWSGVSRESGPSLSRPERRETNSCRSTLSTPASTGSSPWSSGTRARSERLANLYLRVSFDDVAYSCLYSNGDWGRDKRGQRVTGRRGYMQ